MPFAVGVGMVLDPEKRETTPMALPADPDFRALIDRMGARAFDESSDVIYGVWADLRLAYTNAAWDCFASKNDGGEVLRNWKLGASVLDACGPALAPFYERAFAAALSSGLEWEHTYACPSDKLARWYKMRVLPIDGRGLVVCHSLVTSGEIVASPGASPGTAAHDATYTTSTGLVFQCCHCRRVRAVGSKHLRWDFVPAFLTRAKRTTSHGLCPICFAYYYHKYLDPDELRAALGEALDKTTLVG
ncbi:MAG: hypothetical protein JWM82_2035 [Myxococcales bacterium]|nr:hypothetical protein [Myxococcales bacterium]